MTKKVLVLWAKHTATNIGIQALAEGASELARMAFGDVEITLHDHDTDGTPLGRQAIQADIGRRSGYVKQLARDFDLVIDTGSGDSFTDIYGVRRLAVMAYTHHAIAKSGVPLVLAPQTIGPFESKLGTKFGMHSLRVASKVYPRDSASAAYARNLADITTPPCPDLVFALPQPAVDAKESGGIYLNVSGLLWRENRHVSATRYRSAILDTVRLLKDRSSRVVLFPHVLRTGASREDDVTAVEEAAGLLGEDIEVYVPTDLAHVRRTLATADAVIGARMHACLNALSVGVPAIAWSYSRKFAPLLNDLEWRGVVNLKDPGTSVAEQTLTLLEANDLQPEFAQMVRDRALERIRRVADDLVNTIDQGGSR